jgi:hypothetical protein
MGRNFASNIIYLLMLLYESRSVSTRACRGFVRAVNVLNLPLVIREHKTLGNGDDNLVLRDPLVWCPGSDRIAAE